MNEKLWEHIWAVFDAWMTQYESAWNYPSWEIQKKIIQHVVNLVLIGYHIDWPAFWNDIEIQLEYKEWEMQKAMIADAFDIKYCSRKHMMDKPRRLAVGLREDY